MARQRCIGSPFLHDESTNDIVGVRDPDGSEFYWQRVPRVGSFYDTTSQTVAANTAVAMAFNTTDISLGVSIVSGSQITFDRSGVYNLQFSCQFVNAAVQVEDTSIWLAKNGVNLMDTNTQLSIPSRHGGTDGQMVAAWNFYQTLVAGDYLQLCWSVTNTLLSIAYLPAQTGPTRPATPSIILTVNEVMA